MFTFCNRLGKYFITTLLLIFFLANYSFATASVTFVVKDAVTNQPVSGVAINGTYITDLSGRTTISGLPLGSNQFNVSAQGYWFNPNPLTLGFTTDGPLLEDYLISAHPSEISGTVSIGGTGLAYVNISALGPDGLISTQTNASGAYSFLHVKNGYYTITPVLAGYGFVPGWADATVVNNKVSGKNFVATKIAYSVIGQISRSNGTPFAGVPVNGGPLGVRVTDLNGAFTFEGLPPGTPFNLLPQVAGFVFTPSPLSGVMGDYNYILPPIVGRVSSDPVVVPEGCTKSEIGTKKVTLDEGTLRLAAYTMRAQSYLVKVSKKRIENRKKVSLGKRGLRSANQIKIIVNKLLKENKALTMDIPEVILNCPNNPYCTTIDNSEQVELFIKNSNNMYNYMRRVSTRLKYVGASKSTRSKVGVIRVKGKRELDRLISVADSVPNQLTACTGS